MKKNILKLAYIFSLAFCTEAISQTIPNNGFESWTTTSRDTLVGWKGTIGIQKITGSGNTGSAVKLVTTSKSDVASLVSGNISCISSCSGQVKGTGIPLNGATGNLTINADFASSQNGAVAAVAFFDVDGVVIPGGVNGYYIGSIAANGTFSKSTISAFLISLPFNFGPLIIPANAKEVIIAFFPEAADPTKTDNKTVGSYVSIDNLVVKAGLTTLTVPNSNFEQWTTINTDFANGWVSSETYMIGSLQKSLLSNSGANSAQITTGNLFGEVQSGVLSLGNVIWGATSAEDKYLPSFKINSIPNSLNFSSKYTPAIGVNDTAAVEIILTKRNGSVTKKVGSGYGYITSSNSFNLQDIPISLLPTETAADSAIVIFYSSRGKGNVNRATGSQLLIDDVSFDYTTVGIDDDLSNNLSISPNPSTGLVKVIGANSVMIQNILGEIVLSKETSLNEVLNLSNLPKGVYLIQTSLNGKTDTKKLVLQ